MFRPHRRKDWVDKMIKMRFYINCDFIVFRIAFKGSLKCHFYQNKEVDITKNIYY